MSYRNFRDSNSEFPDSHSDTRARRSSQLTVTALMSLSWPGKVCLHMPSRMSHNYKIKLKLLCIFSRKKNVSKKYKYLCRSVTCARNEGAKIRRQGERHNVTSVACVSCALLSRFDVPECTEKSKQTVDFTEKQEPKDTNKYLISFT